jgi:excinuclease ABC subunit C
MQTIAVEGDLDRLDAALAEVPDAPAVFLLRAGEGQPYLARTALLKRRLLRLLAERAVPSRMLNLRHTVTSIEYWLTGSALESSLRVYDLAREHFPKDYIRTIRLRMPSYLRLVLSNAFPRTFITTQLSGSRSLYVGPFRSRASAERFESEYLALFQLRRCQEDLVPSPEHPGCMYGEMGMCTRPCQQAVSVEEYAGEVHRAAQFLATEGASLATSISAARDQCSASMDFEEAARQHKRLERVESVVKLRDELARNLDHLHAITITRSAGGQAVELGFVQAGYWQGFHRMDFELVEGKPVSLDRRLRDIVERPGRATHSPRQRQEHLAILSRWLYASWCDGEMIVFDKPGAVPYRRLVHAISRVAGGARE